MCSKATTPSPSTATSWARPTRRTPRPAPSAPTSPTASKKTRCTAPTPPTRRSRRLSSSSKRARSAPAPANYLVSERADKINLLNLDRQALEAYFAEFGEKPFRASQVLQWVHQRGVDDFDAMTTLSKALRTRLQESAEIRLPEEVMEQATRGGTRKWLIKVDGGNSVETEFIPEDDRGTLCVSSQVGCTLNCSYSSTSQQGFNRNLSTAEIIGQLFVAYRALGDTPKGERRFSNVVMMGLGEPLLNFDNVVRAMNIMIDDFAYGLSKRRVT